MLNMNFDLDITEYVTVGFDALIETIDELGGIDIDVHDNEIDHLNNYQRSMFVENENDALNEEHRKGYAFRYADAVTVCRQPHIAVSAMSAMTSAVQSVSGKC